MENNSKIETEEQIDNTTEDNQETSTTEEPTSERSEESSKRISSKISDLRELQHMIDPHKKFDLIENWMGDIEDFKIYKEATNEEVKEVLELMENLREFVLEYSKVLYAERKKTTSIETYIK